MVNYFITATLRNMRGTSIVPKISTIPQTIDRTARFLAVIDDLMASS